MKERTVNDNISILTNNQSPIVPEPSERAFNLPSALVTPHFAPVMILAIFVIAPIRADQFDSTLGQTFTKPVAVVALIGNEPLGIFPRPTASFTRNRYRCKCSVDEFYFRRGRRVQVVSQRNTLAVDHHHPLCALAPAGFADAGPPFLAGAKLPSIKASDQSNCPFSSNSARNARHALSQIACSSQSFSRRQHVEGLGYFLGKSAHGAPVRRIQRIPSKTLRLSAQGRPPRFDLAGLGKSASIFFHCVSVSLQRSFAIEKTPFNDKIGISP